MVNDYRVKGSCLCGSVTYEITGHMGIFQYCHCSRCRKFTGSAHASNLFVKKDDFRWLSGEEHIGTYTPGETKYFRTCFCKNCGSTLPWLEKSGRTMVVGAGTLDEDPQIKPKWNIFTASKAPWHEETSNLPKYDTLPGKPG